MLIAIGITYMVILCIIIYLFIGLCKQATVCDECCKEQERKMREYMDAQQQMLNDIREMVLFNCKARVNTGLKNADKCIFCGDIIPEGYLMCPKCEKEHC